MSVQLEELQIINIIPSGDNPRTINENSVAFVELTESIRAQGVIVPVHVRIHPKKKGRFELLAGERRLKAATKAKRGLIPAINHGKISDEAAFEIAFTENFAREDLTPLEQGRAVATLMEKYKGDTEAVASKMGKSIKWIRQRQALGTKLSKPWQSVLIRDCNYQKHWTASHLQRVAALPEPMQKELLEHFPYYRQPTLKEIDKQIADMLQLLNKAKFDTDAAGCAKCQKRTSCQPGLFDDNLEPEALKKNDRCLDRSCWDTKTLDWLKSAFEVKKQEQPDLVLIATEPLRQNSSTEKLRDIWPNFLRYYDFEQARKKDKGAVPGFIVYGKALGTILWVEPFGSAARKAGKSTGTPTPLKQRRALLKAKRWSRVLIVLREKVENTDVSQLSYKNKIISVMALVAIYGNEPAWSANTGVCQKEIKRLREHHRNNPTLAFSETLVSLWNSFKPTLDQLLTYNGPITQTPERFIKDAKWIAELISVDINGIFKEVSKQKGFTVPKSWASLNADGTPKTGKPKKKTIKKKQQKAKGKKNVKS